MKITNVRAIQPMAPGSPPDWRTNLGQILVAIDTDRGLTGYGVGGGGLAAVHIVRTELRHLLLGHEPDPIDRHWQAMYDATLPYGRKGVAIMALSAIDLALWDLRGKMAGAPVAVLLGGKTGRPIPTYTTVWDEIHTEEIGKHTAFKLHTGRQSQGNLIETVVAAVERTRTLLGPEKRLMIDAWMKWDVPETLAIAQRIAPLRIDWIEEPISPDDSDGYAELRDKCPIPIAGGEHEFTSRAFADLIEQRLHTVLQPDVCWCGGMTELIRIYTMANNAGVRVCPHRGAEIWGLHAIAALDRQPLAESGRPWMNWVGGQPPVIDGLIQLSDTPGFGAVIDENSIWSAA